MPFRVNEFMKRYQGYFQGHPMYYPTYLRTDIFEHTNRVNDYHDPENTIPVLVGDEHRALGCAKRRHSFILYSHPPGKCISNRFCKKTIWASAAYKK